ncbi:MAG: hypothetical protein IJK23_07260 [Clostridia bacterium]|nr:hypothetical protein [Clostridia bacterium]
MFIIVPRTNCRSCGSATCRIVNFPFLNVSFFV